jgi:hypothetical protein
MELAWIAVCVCAAVLVWIWIPSSFEKDIIRTRIVHPPALGYWIYSVEDLKAVNQEVLALRERVDRQIDSGEYTAEMHFANMERLIDLEKSLLPMSGGYADAHIFIPARSTIDDREVTFQAANISRVIESGLNQVTNDITHSFMRMPRKVLDRSAELAQEAGLFERKMRRVDDDDWHAGPFFGWLIKTHIESMGVVFFFFLLRAQFIGQRRRILVFDAPKTIFWMFFWPIGIWRYPTNDPVVFVRILQHRLAMAVSVFFSIAVPNFALAQSSKAEGQKKREQQNTLTLGVEAVDKYVGSAVGEIFQPDPGLRLMGRYTRATSKGNFYIDSWNSAGRGFNRESDIGVGYQRSGWDVSLARYFVRIGDIAQISVAKSGSVPVAGRSVPFGANLMYYRGLSSASPPGGVVFKLSSSTAHRIPGLSSSFQLRHRVALGVDNNPFGLGEGVSASGFYTAEVGYKSFYLDYNASRPLLGTANTTRGFRQSFAVGYRHAFAW